MQSLSSTIRGTSTWAFKSLRAGSINLFGALMLANGVGYLYQMLMARMMTPSDYGVLVTLTSISYVLTVLMRTVQAWVIEAVASRRSGTVQLVFWVALRAMVPLGVLAFAAIWLASGAAADFLQISNSTPLIVLGLYTFSSFLVPVPRGVLMGVKKISAASFVLVLEPIVRVGSAVLLVAWGLSVNGAIAGFAVGNFVSFIVSLFLIGSLLTRKAQPNAGEEPAKLRAIDRYAFVMLAVNTCLMVMSSVDQVAVKHYFSEQIAGQYAVAFLLGRVIVMVAMSLGWVVFTRSATMLPGDPRRAHLMTRALVLVGAISVSLTGAYLLAPGLAVHLMGGADYSSAVQYVGMVGIEMTLFSLIYIQAYYLISLRKTQVIWPLLVGVALEIGFIAEYHDTVIELLIGLISVMSMLLVVVSSLSWWLLRAHADNAIAVARPSTNGEISDITRQGVA
jgi:O-antigen/teichoic acid export membrane protein